MLGFNEVCWYDQVLRRGDGYVLRRALGFEVEITQKGWKAEEDMEEAG